MLPETPLDAPSRACLPLPAIGERRRVPDASERFGILLHALLEQRTEGGTNDARWRQWLKEQGFGESDCRRVLPVAERVLGAPHLQRFFDPAAYRRAWNEVELTAGDGLVQRLDRLVEFAGDDDALWVLDYKSSRSDTACLEDYREQVTKYCEAVTNIFPGRAVHGALVFADASMLTVC